MRQVVIGAEGSFLLLVAIDAALGFFEVQFHIAIVLVVVVVTNIQFLLLLQLLYIS